MPKSKQVPIVDNNFSMDELVQAKRADLERLANFLGLEIPAAFEKTHIASLIRYRINNSQ